MNIYIKTDKTGMSTLSNIPSWGEWRLGMFCFILNLLCPHGTDWKSNLYLVKQSKILLHQSINCSTNSTPQGNCSNLKQVQLNHSVLQSMWGSRLMMPVKMQSLIFPFTTDIVLWSASTCDSWVIPCVTRSLTITAIIIAGWGWKGTDIENIHHTMGRW